MFNDSTPPGVAALGGRLEIGCRAGGGGESRTGNSLRSRKRSPELVSDSATRDGNALRREIRIRAEAKLGTPRPLRQALTRAGAYAQGSFFGDVL